MNFRSVLSLCTHFLLIAALVALAPGCSSSASDGDENTGPETGGDGGAESPDGPDTAADGGPSPGTAPEGAEGTAIPEGLEGAAGEGAEGGATAPDAGEGPAGGDAGAVEGGEDAETDGGPEGTEGLEAPDGGGADGGSGGEPMLASGPGNALDPDVTGPYKVGVTTFTFTVRRKAGAGGYERELPVEVWYPIADADATGPQDAYDFNNYPPPEMRKLIEDKGIDIPPLQQPAYRDKPVMLPQGPYPLVLFSHGSGGMRIQSVFFYSELASHGYIIAAMDHPGNTAWDLALGGVVPTDMAQSMLDRVPDVSDTLTEMLEKNDDPEDMFYGSINPDRIGVAGHSFGATTSVIAAGTDARFKASIPMAPLLGPEGFFHVDLTQYPVPIMIMGAELDDTLDYEQSVGQHWEKISRPKYLLKLLKGGHFSFSDICKLDLAKYADVLGLGNAESILNDGCAEHNTPEAFAHDTINYFAIAFLNLYLRDSEPSLEYLQPPKASAKTWAEFTAEP